MKIFLSSIENTHKGALAKILKNVSPMKYNLMSFYYYKKDIFNSVRDRSEEILIDSGAHSFQKGKKVDWVEYTKKYADFIREFDRPNVLGYFEMDVDNVIGYDKVLELRKILDSASDKIIPVWHKGRGINDFKEMCRKYAGKVVAITGFKNEDIRDDQYLMFLKYAKKFNCRVHCLGMTRTKILDKIPFDYTDSSSWKQQAIYGKIGNRQVTREYTNNHMGEVQYQNYLLGVEMQKYYFRKWIHYV